MSVTITSFIALRNGDVIRASLPQFEQLLFRIDQEGVNYDDLVPLSIIMEAQAYPKNPNILVECAVEHLDDLIQFLLNYKEDNESEQQFLPPLPHEKIHMRSMKTSLSESTAQALEAADTIDAITDIGESSGALTPPESDSSALGGDSGEVPESLGTGAAMRETLSNLSSVVFELDDVDSALAMPKGPGKNTQPSYNLPSLNSVMQTYLKSNVGTVPANPLVGMSEIYSTRNPGGLTKLFRKAIVLEEETIINRLNAPEQEGDIDQENIFLGLTTQPSKPAAAKVELKNPREERVTAFSFLKELDDAAEKMAPKKPLQRRASDPSLSEAMARKILTVKSPAKKVNALDNDDPEMNEVVDLRSFLKGGDDDKGQKMDLRSFLQGEVGTEPLAKRTSSAQRRRSLDMNDKGNASDAGPKVDLMDFLKTLNEESTQTRKNVKAQAKVTPAEREKHLNEQVDFMSFLSELNTEPDEEEKAAEEECKTTTRPRALSSAANKVKNVLSVSMSVPKDKDKDDDKKRKDRDKEEEKDRARQEKERAKEEAEKERLAKEKEDKERLANKLHIDKEQETNIERMTTVLQNIIADPEGFTVLLGWMKRNGKVDNLLFYDEARKFESLNPGLLASEGWRIFHQYLSPSAPQEVSLNKEDREYYVDLLGQRKNLQGLHNHSLQRAKTCIIKKMVELNFISFVRSKEYSEWMSRLGVVDGNAISTLRKLLKTPGGISAFTSYLTTQSPDNKSKLLFIEEVDNFNSCNPAIVVSRGTEIISNFIKPGSPNDVHLSSSMTGNLTGLLTDRARLIKEMNQFTFDKAREAVLQRLKSHITDFTKSDEFAKWLKRASGRSKTEVELQMQLKKLADESGVVQEGVYFELNSSLVKSNLADSSSVSASPPATAPADSAPQTGKPRPTQSSQLVNKGQPLVSLADAMGKQALTGDAKLPDAKMPDAKMPNANLPDAKFPDTKLPDAKLPDEHSKKWSLLDAKKSAGDSPKPPGTPTTPKKESGKEDHKSKSRSKDSSSKSSIDPSTPKRSKKKLLKEGSSADVRCKRSDSGADVSRGRSHSTSKKKEGSDIGKKDGSNVGKKEEDDATKKEESEPDLLRVIAKEKEILSPPPDPAPSTPKEGAASTEPAKHATKPPATKPPKDDSTMGFLDFLREEVPSPPKANATGESLGLRDFLREEPPPSPSKSRALDSPKTAAAASAKPLETRPGPAATAPPKPAAKNPDLPRESSAVSATPPSPGPATPPLRSSNANPPLRMSLSSMSTGSPVRPSLSMTQPSLPGRKAWGGGSGILGSSMGINQPSGISFLKGSMSGPEPVDVPLTHKLANPYLLIVRMVDMITFWSMLYGRQMVVYTKMEHLVKTRMMKIRGMVGDKMEELSHSLDQVLDIIASAKAIPLKHIMTEKMPLTPEVVFQQPHRQIAASITAVMMKLLLDVPFNVILTKGKTKKDASELERKTKKHQYDQFTTSFNNLSAWVMFTILSFSDIGERVECLQHILQIAGQLFKMKNFLGTGAILAGIDRHPIIRLRGTFARLPSKYTKLLKLLKSVFSPDGNYGRMRELHTSCLETPCIPFMPMFGKDLVFLQEMPTLLPDYPDPEGYPSLNFFKLRRIGDVCSSIVHWQTMCIDFTVRTEGTKARDYGMFAHPLSWAMLDMMTSNRVFLENEMDRRSAVLEPPLNFRVDFKNLTEKLNAHSTLENQLYQQHQLIRKLKKRMIALATRMAGDKIASPDSLTSFGLLYQEYEQQQDLLSSTTQLMRNSAKGIGRVIYREFNG